MKARLKTVFIILLTILLPSQEIVMAGIGGNKARYAGGSIAGISQSEEVKLELTGNAMTMVVKGQTLNIPYKAITSIEYGQKAGRRVGAAITTAILVAPVGLFLLFSKKRKHFLTVSWKEGESAQEEVAIIELGKDIIRETLAVVKSRSSVDIVYQDKDAAEQMGKGDRTKTSAPTTSPAPSSIILTVPPTTTSMPKVEAVDAQPMVQGIPGTAEAKDIAASTTSSHPTTTTSTSTSTSSSISTTSTTSTTSSTSTTTTTSSTSSSSSSTTTTSTTTTSSTTTTTSTSTSTTTTTTTTTSTTLAPIPVAQPFLSTLIAPVPDNIQQLLSERERLQAIVASGSPLALASASNRLRAIEKELQNAGWDESKRSLPEQPSATIPISLAAKAEEIPLTCDDILALKEAGFGDEVLVAKIKSTSGKYLLDRETLIRLKKAGLSDVVIMAMFEAGKKQ